MIKLLYFFIFVISTQIEIVCTPLVIVIVVKNKLSCFFQNSLSSNKKITKENKFLQFLSLAVIIINFGFGTSSAQSNNKIKKKLNFNEAHAIYMYNHEKKCIPQKKTTLTLIKNKKKQQMRFIIFIFIISRYIYKFKIILHSNHRGSFFFNKIYNFV